jgi:hypothetical protein
VKGGGDKDRQGCVSFFMIAPQGDGAKIKKAMKGNYEFFDFFKVRSSDSIMELG